MTTRKQDAESIIDDPDLIEEIDAKAKLLGKSETEQELPDGMVVRGDEEDLGPDGTEVIVEQMGDDDEYHHMPFGGAMSLEAAQAYMDAQERMDQVHSNWSMFQNVMQNIMKLSEPNEVKSNVQDLLTEFSDRVAAIKAAIEDVALVESYSTKGELPIMTQQQQTHPADTFKALYDEIMADTSLGREERTKKLQEAMNGMGSIVKAQLDAVNPPDPTEAITKAFTPIAEKLDLLLTKLGNQQPAQQMQPTQKSLTPTGAVNPVQPAKNGDLPISPVTGKPSKITAQVRRSVGFQQ